MTLGVLSDTHGFLDQRIHHLFESVDGIIHAGDIGNDDIILELQTIAPVVAVRGNMDRSGQTARYHDVVTRAFHGIRFVITHDIGHPSSIKRPLAHLIQQYCPQVIIFGHTHVPYNAYRRETLYFNPGSCSNARQGKQESVGMIRITHSQAIGKIIPLDSH